MGDDMTNEEGKHRITVRRNICIRKGNKRLIISDDGHVWLQGLELFLV